MRVCLRLSGNGRDNRSDAALAALEIAAFKRPVRCSGDGQGHWIGDGHNGRRGGSDTLIAAGEKTSLLQSFPRVPTDSGADNRRRLCGGVHVVTR